MSNLGTDFACVDDINANLSQATSGNRCLAEAIARRISTARGTLFYDTDYGTDIRSRLNGIEAREITALAIENEALKDERVKDVKVALDFGELGTAQQGTLLISLELTASDGPFVLVLSVNDLTVEILEQP